MKRVITPLGAMGARIRSQEGNGCAPLLIEPAPLKGISWKTEVASAQVKSAILLAGLFAEGDTTVTEPEVSRNHTEIMLKAFGGKLAENGRSVTVTPPEELYAQDILVPGDISSAAYFAAAACLLPNSEVLVNNVGTNPTRDGFLRVLAAMGAGFDRTERKGGAEPAADILFRSSSLRGTEIGGELIPSLIDEIQILAVLACFAEGPFAYLRPSVAGLILAGEVVRDLLGVKRL